MKHLLLPLFPRTQSLALLIGAIIFSAPLFAQSAGQSSPSLTVTVAVPKANVRKMPNLSSPVLGSVFLGDELEVVPVLPKNGFYPVRFNKGVGWIHTSTIETESGAEVVSRADNEAPKSIYFRGRNWYWLVSTGSGDLRKEMYFEAGGLQKLYFQTYEVWTLSVPVNRTAFIKRTKINRKTSYLLQNLKADCDGDRLSTENVQLFSYDGESLGNISFSSTFGERVVPGSVGEDIIRKMCKGR